MPNLNAQFQGATLIQPGAYYADSVAGNLPLGPANTPPAILIAYMHGLAPNVPTTFADPQDAIAAMRGAASTSFIPFLYNPSNQVNGAGLVTLINASENTQGSFAMKSGTPTTVLNWTTANYGLPSNMMQLGVTSGSIAGVKISLFDGYSNQSATQDNLGVPMQVTYLGTGTVTLTVTATANTASSMVLTSSVAGESLTISLGSTGYATVSAVAAYLNGSGHFLANVIGDGSIPSQCLDAAASVSLPAPSGSVDTYVGVTATLGAITWWATQYLSGMVTCAIASGIVSGPTMQPAPLPLTHFSGATSVPPVTADYAAAFNAALLTPGWAVCADSNSAAVIALGAQHAVQASGITVGAWRRFFTGSSVGDGVASATANARILDATQATYCYPGIQRTNTTTGLNQIYGGLYVAAAMVGMVSGNPVPMALTNKALVGNGVEVGLTLAQIDTLQQGGVSPIVSGPNGVPVVCSDITSWQLDNNPENCFNQQVGIRQALAYALTQGMQPYVGSIESPLMIGIKKKAAMAILNALIYTPGGNGFLASWNPKSLALTYTGPNQTLAISVQVVPVGQDRFITIYVNVEPLNLSV